MIKVMNSLNVAVSCLGNHDLDFGIKIMKELTSQTGKWILSNLYVDDRPIGDLETFDVREFPLANSDSDQKLKIGFFGLAGPDWIAQLGPEVHEEL